MHKVMVMLLMFYFFCGVYANPGITKREDVIIVEGVIVDVDFHPEIPEGYYNRGASSNWTIRLADGRMFTFQGSSQITFELNKNIKFYLVKLRENGKREVFTFAGFTEERLEKVIGGKDKKSKAIVYGTLLGAIIIFGCFIALLKSIIFPYKEEPDEFQEAERDFEGEKSTKW